MLAIDAHQHVWTQPLWEALRQRNTPPFLRVHDGRATLHLPAEPACELAPPVSVREREALLDRDAVDLALVVPSTALGVEWLPLREAAPLLDAYREGVAGLGSRFGWWAQVSMVDPDLSALADDLNRGAVGLCLSAGAISDRGSLDRVGPLLDYLAERDVPLFVHPGPGPRQRAQGDASRWRAEPWWWASVTDYVDEMQRAWLLWATQGRREHPTLRVLFAMLAGLAPLHLSRLQARGAQRVARAAREDALTFFDTSSYDAHVRRAVAGIVGESQLVHGSDRPVVDGDLPAPSRPDELTINAHHLLGKAA